MCEDVHKTLETSLQLPCKNIYKYEENGKIRWLKRPDS